MTEAVSTSISLGEVAKQGLARFRDGCRNGAFLGTFFLAVVVFAGMGVWVDFLRQGSAKAPVFLPMAILTYGFAILANIGIDLLLDEAPEPGSGEYYGRKARRIFGYLFGVIAMGLMAIGVGFKDYSYSLCGIAISWLLWFVFYEDDDKYKDKVDPGNLLGKGVAGAGLQ